jgi:hypothetical protein
MAGACRKSREDRIEPVDLTPRGDFADLAAAGQDWELISTGHKLPEGPAADRQVKILFRGYSE